MESSFQSEVIMPFALNIDKCPFQDAFLVFLFIVFQIGY